jgi:hypothetical protein
MEKIFPHQISLLRLPHDQFLGCNFRGEIKKAADSGFIFTGRKTQDGTFFSNQIGTKDESFLIKIQKAADSGRPSATSEKAADSGYFTRIPESRKRRHSNSLLIDQASIIGMEIRFALTAIRFVNEKVEFLIRFRKMEQLEYVFYLKDQNFVNSLNF